MSERDLAPGTVLLGKYRVDEHLGVGGMGRVIRASHLYLQQSVAIKVLLPQMTESPSTVARFLREAQAAVRLKSEHSARVIDVGTMPDGRPYMIMEYLEGNDLNQILRHHGPQDPAIVCDLMLQACEGLAEAHAIGIVHRDIKLSNFFITRRPDGSMLLKLLDFGISKTPIGYDDNLTTTQNVIGTPSYMSPEQMKSGKQADARSDIWSMGVVMYQLLQGRPPFAAESYAELVLKVANEPPTPLHVPLPPGFGAAILRCLEKDPNRRHQNVGELARMLAPYATDPITAAQIANRATRILQTRASQPSVERGALPGQQSLPVGANGGLAIPAPLSPAQHTPRSWPPSPSASGTSTGGRGEVGRSQLTQRTGSGRGWLIAGAMSLTILAASGGYIASTVMKDDAPASTTSPAPAIVPATAPSPEPAVTETPTTPTVTPTVTAVPTIAPATETATAPATTEAITSEPAKTEPTKPETTKAETTKAEPTKTEPTKTETTKTETTKTEPTKTETTPKTTASKTSSNSSSANKTTAPTKTTSTKTTAPTETTAPTKTTSTKTTAPTKTTPTKTTSTKTTAPTKTKASSTKTSPTKTETTKTKSETKPKSGGLFDSRH